MPGGMPVPSISILMPSIGSHTEHAETRKCCLRYRLMQVRPTAKLFLFRSENTLFVSLYHKFIPLNVA